VAQAAERALAAEGYGMMLVSSGDRHEDEVRALEMLRTHRMDGMIVYVGDEGDTRMIGTLGELGGPCVVLDRTLPIEADVVLSDHAPALEEAIGYLVSLGHRSLAMVMSDRQVRPVFERRKAFQAAIVAAGLDPERQTIVGVRPEEKARFRAADLFARAAPPTAVLVDGSRLLRAVMDGLRRHRLRIPDDVSVVGIDVEDVAPMMTPELTRISRDYGEIGRTAAGFLLNRIRSGPGPRQTALLESHVLLKSSCAPLTQSEGVG
jgi:DNA-binding LacI/PurR family transcriptional regulator